MIPAIGDNEIIELSVIYDSYTVNKSKDYFGYLRDATYNAYGYAMYRAMGLSHEDAKAKFQEVSENNAYYTGPLNGMIQDSEVIELAQRWSNRYTLIGRLQKQSRQENARDIIYWTIYFARNRSYSLENSLQDMENAMAQEASITIPYPVIKNIVSRLRSNGKLFINEQNQIFRSKGVTAFNLLDKFSKGIKDPFLDNFPEANTARIFLYTPISDWHEHAWGIPDTSVIIEFFYYLKELGFYGELSLITDNDSSKLSQIKNIISKLSEANLDNIFLEAVNEPFIHDKVDPIELKNALNSCPYLYSSGVYTDLKKFYGRYGTMHTPGDNEWPRKAKDLLEAYNGGGPNFPDEPPCKVPWVANEIIRPDNAGFNDLDYYTYASVLSLMSSGGTFHCLSAELTNGLSNGEMNCAKAFFNGLKIFPLDAANGEYNHRRDLEGIDANNNPTKALRVFQVGQYATVVRPTGFNPPNDWKSLDNFGVCFKVG